MKLQKRTVDHDGNSFFNAVSGALQWYSHIELREKMVDHLMKLKDFYYPQTGLLTMEEYCQRASEYLLDGHLSSDFENIVPDAMAGALEIRIHIMSSTSTREDRFCGSEHSQTVIQLVHNSSGGGHYDYTVPVNTPEHTRVPDNSPPPHERGIDREYTPTRELPRPQHNSSQISRQLFYDDQRLVQ